MAQVTANESKEQSVILHDRFDTATFNETSALYPPLQEISEAGAIPDAPIFVEDLFHAFYKPAPTLANEGQLTLTAQVRRRLIAETMSTAEYQHARTSGTIADQYTSAIATAAVSYQVLDKLDRKTKSRLRDLQEAEAEAEQLFSQASSLEQLAAHTEDDAAEQMNEEAEQLRDQAETAQERAEQLYSELENDIEQIEDVARRAARAALQQAQGEINEVNDAIAAYGGYSHEQGSPALRMNAKQKLELARRIKGNKKLARIAELAGKMINTALNKQRTKVVHPPDEIVGITTGADLSKLLSSELVKLGDEYLEMQFYLQYLEQSLMQLDMIGHQPQAKGAIIGCVDLSGSMDELLMDDKKVQKKLKGLNAQEQERVRREELARAYTKEIWSKAVLLALLAIARHQKRDFCIVFFGSYGEIRAYEFPKAQTSTAELIDVAEFFFGGGTVYDGWMSESLAISEKSRFEHADVIVISDGDVGIAQRVKEDFNARRNAKQMHSYGVLLENEAHARYTGENLQSVTDQMITVTDLENDSVALDVLFTI